MRIRQGQLIPKLIRRNKPKSVASRGGYTEIFGWYDPATNEQVAETHQYTLPDGTIGGSGEIDPKKVLWNGVLIEAYQGKDLIKRDPCFLFPEWRQGFIRRMYGSYRKYCCRKLGPEGDAKLAAWQTPTLRKLFFFWDSCRS
jgi:hypothetical protein